MQDGRDSWEHAVSHRKDAISVIICAYTMDRWDDLCAALASVHAQLRRPDEVILVIDHNPALLARAQAAFAGVRVVANEQRQGLSGARNTGLALSRGDLVAFLDDDAVAAPGWLAALETGFDDARLLGATGLVEPSWIGAKPRWFPDAFLWTVGCSFEGSEAAAGGEVRNVMGCSMMFRRAVFEAIGGFSHRLGRTGAGANLLSCEETEYCIRARAAFPQGIFVSVGGAVVSHRVPARRMTLRYFCKRTFAEGISKAIVASLAPQPDVLGTERRYVFGALGRAVLRDLGTGLGRLDRFALARAASIVLGLSCAAAGFLKGRSAARGMPPAGQAAMPTALARSAGPGGARL